ncbi:MAG TPA: histidine kinase dimerization/phosphoacceptor domain -containing protein, partial [Chitinophagaceae bacterium]|nr:histidine kinase dimerization/phosphoacceptor domain -containing protein [Chitinophagaceae bacterium]
ETAQKITDSIYKGLQSQKNNKALLLEIKYKKALILDRQEKPPNEPLSILLDIIDEVHAAKLHSLLYRIYLLIALCHEKAANLELTNKYLNEAYSIYEKYKLENLYSMYCIRRGSYYRFLEKIDSVFYFANQAKENAVAYNNEKVLVDSYILLAFAANRNKNYTAALECFFQLKNYRVKYKDTSALAMSYINIAQCYKNMKNFQKALIYSDSSFVFFKSKPTFIYSYQYSKIKYEIFEALGNMDSAYYYLKQYQQEWSIVKNHEVDVKTNELEKQYQSNKKEAIINSKNQQLFFIIILLFVITVGSILIVRQNRKISKQNKIINNQIDELSKIIEQKQMLLSELQHRVKNNLQHVISILEIQKESVDFNNIDELIRGNQNRIHSMALLHKKLNISENVNEEDLPKYISELSELVKDSYDNHTKKIQLNVKCEIDKIALEKALPIGLIIVELVSNSMKYAFLSRSIGIINILLSTNHDTTENTFYYTDNGEGFDFNAIVNKGLGIEIIKGLISQLDGKYETSNSKGFEFMIYFK